MLTVFNRTTTGWLATVNNINKWFIKYADDGKYDVYEIMDDKDACLLRITAADLVRAKTYIYLQTYA